MPPQVDLPALEHEVLDFWRDRDVFAATLEQTADGPQWTFYEGPPTANGMPGTHHVEARVFKDVFPRYRTMRGYHVPRRAGWDCHGLPVELAVEKGLGFTGKQDIEAYGIAEFNAKCRESVLEHVDAFARMSERMGYWVDFDNAYWTMDPRYIESVWWSLKTDLRQGPAGPGLPGRAVLPALRHRPVRSRGRAGLSRRRRPVGLRPVPAHERSAGRARRGAAGLDDDAVDAGLQHRGRRQPGGDLRRCPPSRLRGAARRRRAAGASRPRRRRRDPRPATRHVAGAQDLLAPVRPRRHPGRALRRAGRLRHRRGRHRPGPPGARVRRATTSRSRAATACRSSTRSTADGHFVADLPLVGGQFFKAADADIVADLQARGLLFRAVAYEHTYPHCWRCHTALMYYALPSWYIRTTAIKDALLRENEATNWFPTTIKHGRYGDWLDNNIDWALSRNRYWGTPLPIWRCAEDHLTVVGSLAELCARTPATDLSALDPHRPFVDDIVIACQTCRRRGPAGARGHRCLVRLRLDAVRAVGRAAPQRGGVRAAYPADFICEAIDQTRGWFYTLMAIGTLVFDRSSLPDRALPRPHPRRGRPQDEQAPRQHPRADPAHGAARRRRGALVHAGRRQPWSARRVGHKALDEVVRKMLLTYWNTASFLVLYARANDWTPGDVGPHPVPADRPALDRWALLRAAPDRRRGHRGAGGLRPDPRRPPADRVHRRPVELVRPPLAPPVLGRRSGRAGDLARVPRVSDPAAGAVRPVHHRRGARRCARHSTPSAPDSVHLRSWPRLTRRRSSGRLGDQMALVRRLVELGRAARAESGSQDPPATGASAGLGGRLGRAAGRPARAGRRRAQRPLARCA